MKRQQWDCGVGGCCGRVSWAAAALARKTLPADGPLHLCTPAPCACPPIALHLPDLPLHLPPPAPTPAYTYPLLSLHLPTLKPTPAYNSTRLHLHLYPHLPTTTTTTAYTCIHLHLHLYLHLPTPTPLTSFISFSASAMCLCSSRSLPKLWIRRDFPRSAGGSLASAFFPSAHNHSRIRELIKEFSSVQPIVATTAVLIILLSLFCHASARRPSKFATAPCTVSKSSSKALLKAVTSLGGICTESLACVRIVHRISHKHQARVSGSGSSHGARTRQVWPIACTPSRKASRHLRVGGRGWSPGSASTIMKALWTLYHRPYRK